MRTRMMTTAPWTAALIGALATASLPSGVRANERHFTYVYESPTLPSGMVELEPWVTWRGGRNQFYNRFDHRLELELGLTDRFQGAVYLNLSAIGADDDMNVREVEFEYEGVSLEAKVSLLDPVADALGLALYAELTAAPAELELEWKVIIDRRFGDALFAANVVFEPEWELGPDENEFEVNIETDIGFAYFVTEHVSLGIEARNVIHIHGEFEHATFFAGPVISYSQGSYWLAFSVTPQLGAIESDEDADDDFRDLDDNEMVTARLLVGAHL